MFSITTLQVNTKIHDQQIIQKNYFLASPFRAYAPAKHPTTIFENFRTLPFAEFKTTTNLGKTFDGQQWLLTEASDS
jgi:hypothetical protein